jgi:serine/threonine protein kinase
MDSWSNARHQTLGLHRLRWFWRCAQGTLPQCFANLRWSTYGQVRCDNVEMQSNCVQLFARKIMRLLGGVTVEDVEREAGLLSELGGSGESATIVEVYQHGWLPHSNQSVYYIDMEYCPETLHQRIHGTSPGGDLLLGASGPGPSQRSMMKGSAPPRDGDSTSPSEPDNDAILTSVSIDWQSIVDIMQEINDGLIRIHSRKIVHRDLKPTNSSPPQCLPDNSPLLRERSTMETIRFGLFQSSNIEETTHHKSWAGDKRLPRT